MTRINPVARDTSDERLQQTFAAIQKQLGVVPNMMRTMAQSPAVLEAYLAFGAALRKGLLPAKLQEQIALAVAEANACDYCLSAHSALGRGAGLSSDEIGASRDARASDPKTAAALQFARAVIDRRGGVTDQDVARVRTAELTDGEIAEIRSALAGARAVEGYERQVRVASVSFDLTTWSVNSRA